MRVEQHGDVIVRGLQRDWESIAAILEGGRATILPCFKGNNFFVQ